MVRISPSNEGFSLTLDKIVHRHTLVEWLLFKTLACRCPKSPSGTGGTLNFASSGFQKNYGYGHGYINYSNVSTSGTIADDTWVHLATTIDDMTLKFYINGSLDSTHTLTTGSKQSQTEPFGVGAISGSGSEGFQGYLDQVSIWNRVLTASEISTIYNSGNGVTDLNEALTEKTWIERGTAI